MRVFCLVFPGLLTDIAKILKNCSKILEFERKFGDYFYLALYESILNYYIVLSLKILFNSDDFLMVNLSSGTISNTLLKSKYAPILQKSVSLITQFRFLYYTVPILVDHLIPEFCIL